MSDFYTTEMENYYEGIAKAFHYEMMHWNNIMKDAAKSIKRLDAKDVMDEWDFYERGFAKTRMQLASMSMKMLEKELELQTAEVKEMLECRIRHDDEVFGKK